LSQNKKSLIVILGPTASGKTRLAIEIAKHFRAEIISADSRQFYKEIPIGTAAPDSTQLNEIRHHFVGHLSINDLYNVSRFESDVISLLNSKFKSHDVMVMTGGSGLYIDAVCSGIDELPDPDEKIRNELEELFEQQGLSALHTKLELLDPEYFNQVDKNNPKRLIRAIEICEQTGKTYTELRKNKSRKRDFNIIKIGLKVPRHELVERIHRRTDQMISQGLLQEAEKVYPLKHLNALNTVGYKELFSYFNGIWDMETAIEKIKTNTRRFAKRQMTWFRKDVEINWFPTDKISEIIEFIENRLET